MSYLKRAFDRDLKDVDVQFVKYSHTQGKYDVFNVTLAKGEKRFRTTIARPTGKGKYFVDAASVLSNILYSCTHCKKGKLFDGTPISAFCEGFMGWDEKTLNQRLPIAKSTNTKALRAALAA